MSTSWQSLGQPSTFWGETITPLASVANALEGVISPIQSILSALQSILNVIRVFIVDTTSALLSIVQALVNQIEEFINTLANSGAYILVVGPSGNNTAEIMSSITGGFDGFVNKVVSSFTNSADPQRPIFDGTQPCTGIVVGVSTGTLANAVNFLAMLSRTFKSLERNVVLPPKINGFAGNGAAVIYFSKPQLPNTLFSTVTYKLQRATVAGGNPVRVSVPASNANAKVTSTLELQRDTQTGKPITTYTTVATIDSGTFLSAVDYMIVDGADSPSPQLVKFNLAKQADTKALATSSVNGFSGQSSFTLRRSVQDNVGLGIFDSFETSTEAQIGDLNNLSERVKYFYINGFYLEVRINGAPIAVSSDGLPQGAYYVTSFDGDTFTLNQPVPLGSKLVAYSYIQALSGDVIRYQQLSKYHRGSYTSIVPGLNTSLTNNQPYYYKIDVLDSTMMTVASSNEIRVVPQLSVAPNPPPAYCIGLNSGPFTFTSENNLFSFSTGLNSYNVRIRPSIQNVFNTGNFESSFGLVLDPKLSLGTQSAKGNIDQGVNGLLLQYTGFDGTKTVVQPGGLIPVDVEDVLADLTTQCNNPSVRFSIRQGRLVIQDLSAPSKGASQIVIGNGSANTVLGFTPGVCSSVTLTPKVHWERYAVKDLVPQINDLAEIIESVANSFLRSTESGVQSILDFIKLIQTKIRVIQNFLTEVETLLNIIKSLHVSLPNLYKLPLPTLSGSLALANEIKNSTNRPPSSPSDFAVGICIVVGGPSSTAAGALLKTLL